MPPGPQVKNFCTVFLKAPIGPLEGLGASNLLQISCRLLGNIFRYRRQNENFRSSSPYSKSTVLSTRDNDSQGDAPDRPRPMARALAIRYLLKISFVSVCSSAP